MAANVFSYQFHPVIMVRRPVYNTRIWDGGKLPLYDESFREAIKFSSPSLYQELEKHNFRKITSIGKRINPVCVI